MRSADAASTFMMAVGLLLATSGCLGHGSVVQPHRFLFASRHSTEDGPPFASSQGSPVEPAVPVARPLSCRPRQRLAKRLAERRPRLWSFYQEMKYKAWTDFENYYRWDVARDLLLATGGASVLANTSLDQDFQDWYQDDVRSSGTDKLADAIGVLGDGRIVIPAVVGLGVVGEIYGRTPCASTMGEFGCRTGRAYLVGAPSVVFMQYCLGNSRPGETRHESRWRPFDDGNGVTGDGFIGAVPLITAARMADNPCLKGALYLGSVLPSWARIHDNAHYLSQAFLGWWMAYLACSAIDQTDREDAHLTLTPIATPETVGIGVVYER